MKLILANNQSPRFVEYYADLAAQHPGLFEYAGYSSLLFVFDTESDDPATFIDVNTGRKPDDFDGVYINSYLYSYELAATVATILSAKGIPFVNEELKNAPSLSKLSSYARLATKGVSMPKTVAGTAVALRKWLKSAEISFPAILKRADADRGIDNFKVKNTEQALEIVTNNADKSIWILQDFIPNDGYYLVSIYHDKPEFSIFRTLEQRPDKNELKAHMYKPKGSANAHLLEVEELPKSLLETSLKAARAMNRQIASVDSIYDAKTGKTYVLEVNYNPQLVTIESFKDVRVKAFIDAIKNIKTRPTHRGS